MLVVIINVCHIHQKYQFQSFIVDFKRLSVVVFFLNSSQTVAHVQCCLKTSPVILMVDSRLNGSLTCRVSDPPSFTDHFFETTC